MKYARMCFNTQFMFESGGIERDVMVQILSKLPPDAKILGFSRSEPELLQFMFIGSNYFKEIKEGTLPPDIQIYMKRLNDGTVVCDYIDASAARPTP